MASIVDDIVKKYGKGTVITGDLVLSKPKNVISFSPILDSALSGGIPEGCWILLSGKPKSGKSVSALQFAANCQQAGKDVFYIDVEGRIQGNQKLIRGIHGLDASKLTIISNTRERIFSAVDFLTIVEDIAKSVPRALIIIDSASALCDASERTDDLTPNTRAKGPKLLASFCRRLSGVVPVNDVNILTIQHLIANTSGYGVPFMEDGGNKIVHQADVKLRAKGFSDWLRTDKSIMGQVVTWDVEFSALGPPGAKVESYIRYGYGIDDIHENILTAIDLNLIEKGGAWYTISLLESDGKAPKFQGMENCWDFFKDNPDKYKILVDTIKGALCK
jgi:recombination protein RecA